MKYLEGNIFVNFYIFGTAGIFAVIIGSFIFTRLGLKSSLFISHVMTIIGCLCILVVQTNVIPIADKERREAFEEKVMPGIILILKMGIIMSFIITT